jgi:hypothetical protein
VVAAGVAAGVAAATAVMLLRSFGNNSRIIASLGATAERVSICKAFE